jgi:DNA helicase-2/ATP-dependent DNA helicase PcrA
MQPTAVVPAYVEREFSFLLDGDRIRGRMDRVDIERLPQGEDSPPAAGGDGVVERQHADVTSPALPGFHPERVTITDYKSSDVRDPAKAKERARNSLQLQIYAMAFQAETGRLPDALQLWFLESGLVGRVEVDEKRLDKARGSIRQAAAGIRSLNFEATPEYIACGYCAFRDICPSSAAK